jgi:hypothetical protein
MTHMPDRTRSREGDFSQVAHRILAEATGQAEPTPEPVEPEKDPAAQSLGRRGGLKGGRARADSMTPEQRSEAARRAARARWAR